MKRTVLSAGLLGVSLALAAPGAFAHTRTMSYSTWKENGNGVQVTLRAPWVEFRRALPALRNVGLADAVGRPEILREVQVHLPAGAKAYRGTNLCAPGPVQVRAEMPAGMIVGVWSAACAGTGDFLAKIDLFFDAAPSHVHLARWEKAGREGSTFEKIITNLDRTMETGGRSAGNGARAGVTGFMALGVRHILSGWDHLLFLSGFLLLGLPLRRLVGLITAFTVAHSLSLAAATMGWVMPASEGIESLIGFSIAVISLDAFRRLGVGSLSTIAAGLAAAGWLISLIGGAGLPTWAWLGIFVFVIAYFRLADAGGNTPTVAQWLVVFMFGLVHGLGFAGALLSMRLEAADVVPALLGFNAGVEIGQLAVLSFLLLLARVASPWAFPMARARFASASALLGMGLFWFWSRLIP